MSKRAQQKQQRLDDRFWKQTWPTLKANGWSVDARDGAFYPPQAQKMHAAKRRRLGSEHKNCFKNIHELTIYLSSNPVLYVGESKSTSGRESAGKGKFTKSRGKFAPQTDVIMTKMRREGWSQHGAKQRFTDKGQFQDIEESSGREAGRFLFQVTILCRSIAQLWHPP